MPTQAETPVEKMVGLFGCTLCKTYTIQDDLGPNLTHFPMPKEYWFSCPGCGALPMKLLQSIIYPEHEEPKLEHFLAAMVRQAQPSEEG